MPDTSKKPVAAAAKPAVDVVADPAPATPPRHDPVPTGDKSAKPDAPVATETKPKAPVVTAAKPAAATAPKVATAQADPVKRKPGRPLGSTKTAAGAAAPKRVVAPKTVSTKPINTPTKPVVPLAAATLNEGSRTMTDTMTKIQDSAKKLTGDAEASTHAMFGDFSTKAKGAYEKSVKLTEELTEFQKGNVEAMVESSKLAAKAAETLGQHAADYARKSYETGTAAFKTFASAKSPTELFKLQSDYVKSYFDSAIAESTKLTESWLKLAGDVAQPLSNRVAVAVEKVKATATI